MNNTAFIEQLVIKANPDIDDEALDLLIEEIQPVLYDRVVNNIGVKLNDEQLAKFTALAKNKAEAKEIQKFLEEAILDYEGFIEQVYGDFEEMYLNEYNK